MATYKQTAIIYAESDGTFTFDNGRQIVFCKDKDSVVEITEQMLCPLMQPLLDSGKDLKIVIEDETNKI